MKRSFALIIIIALIGLGLYSIHYLGITLTQIWTWVKTFFYYAFILYVVGIGIMIFLDNNNPHTTISWLLVLFLLPYIGFVLYIVLGRNVRKKSHAHLKVGNSDSRFRKLADVQREVIEYMKLFDNDEGKARYIKLIKLLLKNSNSLITLNNEIKILTNGDEKFDELLRDLRSAKAHIHAEYYIIKDDEIGNKFKNLLIDKAKEGLEVRLVYDAVGCWRLKKSFIQDLKDAGVYAYPFYPVVFPIFSRELNYRNHRKIVVIDGEVGYVGGINIGDEYLGKNPHFGFWRDTHMKIKGEAVKQLQKIFLDDWKFVSGEIIDHEKYFPNPKFISKQVLQISASGPDSYWESIHQGYFEVITSAKDYLWIQTPYLVPDDSIKMALKTAALSGVDVKIIIPGKADHFFVYWASRDNILELLKAGVKIYTYEDGFIHSKVLIADGQIASTGTANLDMRSFGINYEVNAFIYDEDTVQKLSYDFILDIHHSKEVLLDDHLKRGLFDKILEALGRIISPIQ